MSVQIFRETKIPPEIKMKSIKEIIKDVLDGEKMKLGEISIIFCDDEYLLKINKNYLDHNYYTDIITFDYSDNNVLSGDLFISVDRVKQNAGTYQKTLKNELFRVIIHGILHLSGYDDKTDEEKMEMRNKEDFYLIKFEGRTEVLNG